MRIYCSINPRVCARPRASVIATGLAAMAILWSMDSRAHDYQREPLFPPQCALREVAAVTNIEARGEAQDIASPLLGDAGLSMLRAREWCYAGRINEALDVYDRIIGLKPLAAGPQ